MTPLEALQRLYDYPDLVYKNEIAWLLEQENLPKYRDIIENALKGLERTKEVCLKHDIHDTAELDNALKRLEKIDNEKVVYMTRTQGQAQKVIDELSKHKEVVITNLSDQKKLKALEIIKNKNVNIGYLLTCSFEYYNELVEVEEELTREEYDLLREVLL